MNNSNLKKTKYRDTKEMYTYADRQNEFCDEMTLSRSEWSSGKVI